MLVKKQIFQNKLNEYGAELGFGPKVIEDIMNILAACSFDSPEYESSTIEEIDTMRKLVKTGELFKIKTDTLFKAAEMMFNLKSEDGELDANDISMREEAMRMRDRHDKELSTLKSILTKLEKSFNK